MTSRANLIPPSVGQTISKNATPALTSLPSFQLEHTSSASTPNSKFLRCRGEVGDSALTGNQWPLRTVATRHTIISEARPVSFLTRQDSVTHLYEALAEIDRFQFRFDNNTVTGNLFR